MVSTRSHSVLSADAAHGDTAATHGEVSSAGPTPTPRRSGRVRGCGAAATADRAPPRSTRSVRSRQHLGAILEEEQQKQQETQQQEQQQQHEEAQQASPASQPAGAVAAEAAAQQAGVAESGEAAAQPLQAGTALVDLLAQEMFAALEGAFGQQQGGSSSSSESGSGFDSEGQQQQHPASGSQQRDAAAAAAAGGDDQQAHVAAAGVEEEHSSGSDSDSDSGSDDGTKDHHVPRHLRWHPDLLLPGMGQQLGRQQPGSQPAGGSAAIAAAGPGAEATAVGVHLVRKGKGGLHVPPPDASAAQKASRRGAPDTAGKGWFDLPATQITEEVKSDLRMLRLRGALDPKSFYKKFDSTKFPKYFQMGTVVEGAADFYSGRMKNKQRKRTFTEEVMADGQLAQVRKKRYTKLQDERSYWSKKKLGRKTNNDRKKKAHHRPKH